MNEYVEAARHCLENSELFKTVFVLVWCISLTNLLVRKAKGEDRKQRILNILSRGVQFTVLLFFFVYVYANFFASETKANAAFLDQYETTLVKLPSNNKVKATFTEEVEVSVGDVVFEVCTEKDGLSLIIDGQKHNVLGSSLVGYNPVNQTYTTNGVTGEKYKKETVFCTVTYIGQGKFSLDFVNGNARVESTLENVKVVSMEDEFATLEVSDAYSFVNNSNLPTHELGVGEVSHVFPSNSFSEIYVY